MVPRKWLFLILMAAVVTFVIWAVSSFSFAAIDLLVVGNGMLLVAWIGISLARNRGQIRIVHILALILLAAFALGMISQQNRSTAIQRRFIELVQRHEGMVSINEKLRPGNQSRWQQTKEGIWIPPFLESTYEFASTAEISFLEISAALLTAENIEAARLEFPLKNHLVLMTGTLRDKEGLIEFCKYLSDSILRVQARELTTDDIAYLSSVSDSMKLYLELENPTLHTLHVAKELQPAGLSLSGLSVKQEQWEILRELLSDRDEIFIKYSDCDGKLFQILDQREKPFQLYLEGTSLDDDAWQELARMKKLVYLHLMQCNVSDKRLEYFEGNTSVESLRVESSLAWINDAGIDSISQMESLKTLYVNGNFSQKSIDNLRSVRTSLEVLDAYSPLLPQRGVQWNRANQNADEQESANRARANE